MWYDKFDGDLYRLIPEAQEIVAPLGVIPLFTRGKPDADGKLNHPACWNSYRGMVAFFGTASLPMEPEGYWTDDPLVGCTAEEALRDCFPHHYVIMLNGCAVFDGFKYRNAYMNLLMDRRGINPMNDSEKQAYIHTMLRNLKVAAQLITMFTH